MRSQKEVTLANDLELRDRLDIYRNFLLYCLSGEVVALPMGSTVVVERDSSEFARLVRRTDTGQAHCSVQSTVVFRTWLGWVQN